MGTGARGGPFCTRPRHRRLRPRPAAGSAGVSPEGRCGRVLPPRQDGARSAGREGRRRRRSEADPARDEAARARIRPGSRRRRRLRDQGSRHRPLVPDRRPRPAAGAGAPSRSPSTGRPRPPSAACGTQFTHEACSSACRRCDRGRSLRGRRADPGRVTCARRRLSISALRTPGVARRPDRGDRRRSATGTDGLRPERRCVAPAGVGREARGLVHRAARARPALSLPHRGRRRRHPDRARLERQPPPRRVRRPDPHAGGPEPARAPRRGHGDQARRQVACSATTRTSTRDGTRSAGSRPTSGSSRGHCRRSPSAGSRSRVRTAPPPPLRGRSPRRWRAGGSPSTDDLGRVELRRMRFPIAFDLSQPLDAHRPADEPRTATTSSPRWS